MKNDYLWDKTGHDTEIEKLENALQVFRCPVGDAPKISSNVISFKKHPPRKVFPVFRALAASFAFVFFLIGIWFYADSRIETAIHKPVESLQTEISTMPKTSDSFEPEKAGLETGLTEDKFENKAENQKPEKQNFKIQKLIYKPKSKKQKVENNQIVKLTAEEKAAFEKLMLALSITGSKLKIVKDKVQNLDEQTAINTENNIDTRKK